MNRASPSPEREEAVELEASQPIIDPRLSRRQRDAAEQRWFSRARDAATPSADFTRHINDALAEYRSRGRRFSVAIIGLHPLSSMTRWRDQGIDRQIALNLENGVRSIRRSTDVLVRFEVGDFGLLSADVASGEEAAEIARRIAGAVARPVTRGRMSVRPIVSAGVVVADLFTEARIALQHARSHEHTTVQLFDTEMRHRLLARFDAVNGIEESVLSRPVRVRYQPIISLRGAGGTSFEALYRPNPGATTTPSAEEVIVFAERSGDIDALGMRVLQEASRFAGSWPLPASPGAGCTSTCRPVSWPRRGSSLRWNGPSPTQAPPRIASASRSPSGSRCDGRRSGSFATSGHSACTCRSTTSERASPA